jgi:hypothetical protein
MVRYDAVGAQTFDLVGQLGGCAYIRMYIIACVGRNKL